MCFNFIFFIYNTILFANNYFNDIYECYLENGIKIDSTLDRNQALLFEVGAKHLIAGLEVAVLRMSAGQLAEVTIPHLYGYGQRGHFPDIPPRSTLIFRLELVEIVAKQGRKWLLITDVLLCDCLSMCTGFLVRGC